MLGSILAVLDLDSDTSVLTQYATDIAARHNAKLTALVAADPDPVGEWEKENGSSREAATAQTDKPDVEEILDTFRKVTRHSNVTSEMLVEQSVPFQRILEDSRYHDLIVVGHDPKFFVNQPKQRTKTLAQVIKAVIPPTLVVRNSHREIERVLVTYDGSTAAARTMQRFAQLLPFGTDICLKVLCAHESTSYNTEIVLHLAKDYLQKHSLHAETASIPEISVHEELLSRANRFEADLIVVGSHTAASAQQLAFGSTAAALLKQGSMALFMHH